MVRAARHTRVASCAPADEIRATPESPPHRCAGERGATTSIILTFSRPIRLPCRNPAKTSREATPGKTSCPMCWPSIRAPHPRAPSCFAVRHLHRRLRAAGIPAAFSGLGLGRARAGGHLDFDHRHLPRGAEESERHRQGHRRHRHHQPARDHRGVGPRHRQGGAPRHRLAGPPHRRYLRQIKERRPRARDLGKDRPDHRSLFFRHQGRLDPRSRARRARARRAWRADVRHRRLLSAVAADRRQGARDRRHQRLAHAAVQHPHRAVGRRVC